MTRSKDLEQALLLLNGWLGRPVRLLVVVRDGAPVNAQPPVDPADGWHVVLGYEAVLGRPAVGSDLERQLTIGTYQLGDRPLRLLLGGLPCDGVEAIGDENEPDRLTMYLPGSNVVVVLHVLADP